MYVYIYIHMYVYIYARNIMEYSQLYIGWHLLVVFWVTDMYKPLIFIEMQIQVPFTDRAACPQVCLSRPIHDSPFCSAKYMDYHGSVYLLVN
jgi:hypothetical protein